MLGACLAGSIGLQLFIPQIIRSFIDLASARGPTSELTRLALTYLGFSILNQLLSAMSTYVSANIGWTATNALRADVFRHALSLDMPITKTVCRVK
jgi:ATP-binding cassette, subfamily B, bacterial